MRKISKIAYAALVLVILAFCLTACGGQKKDMSATDSAPSSGGGSEVAAASKEEAQLATDEVKISDEEQDVSADADREPDGDMAASETDGAGSTDDEETPVAKASESRVLVAYFSATGTTKKLAEYAAEVMGADLYEIVPEEPYTDADLNYNDRNSRTSIEMNDKSIKPAISGSVSDMAQYDTLFLGYPIWWGDAPHIMDTFMESYDFSGKTIVPFCTSGSSGIGSSAKNLHRLTDSSVTWLDGDRLPGGLSKEDMAEWIRGLSLGIEVK